MVAVALLPLFEKEPRCHEAAEWLDDDTHGSFTEYLQVWHARVPETAPPCSSGGSPGSSGWRLKRRSYREQVKMHGS